MRVQNRHNCYFSAFFFICGYRVPQTEADCGWHRCCNTVLGRGCSEFESSGWPCALTSPLCLSFFVSSGDHLKVVARTLRKCWQAELRGSLSRCSPIRMGLVSFRRGVNSAGRQSLWTRIILSVLWSPGKSHAIRIGVRVSANSCSLWLVCIWYTWHSSPFFKWRGKT